MDFHKYVKSRGFPAKFKTMKEFEAFSNYMRDMYSKLGVPVDDIRIQGSAVRSPLAGDVDVVAMVDQSVFDGFVKQAFNGYVKVKKDGKFIPIKLNEKDSAGLMELAEKINRLVKAKAPEASAYNGIARNDFRFVYLAKMINAVPFKKQFKNVFDLPGALEKLKKAFPQLNIDNFTIQVKGGFYDSYPFMNIK